MREENPRTLVYIHMHTQRVGIIIIVFRIVGAALALA